MTRRGAVQGRDGLKGVERMPALRHRLLSIAMVRTAQRG